MVSRFFEQFARRTLQWILAGAQVSGRKTEGDTAGAVLVVTFADYPAILHRGDDHDEVRHSDGVEVVHNLAVRQADLLAIHPQPRADRHRTSEPDALQRPQAVRTAH